MYHEPNFTHKVDGVGALPDVLGPLVGDYRVLVAVDGAVQFTRGLCVVEVEGGAARVKVTAPGTLCHQVSRHRQPHVPRQDVVLWGVGDGPLDDGQVALRARPPDRRRHEYPDQHRERHGPAGQHV